MKKLVISMYWCALTAMQHPHKNEKREKHFEKECKAYFKNPQNCPPGVSLEQHRRLAHACWLNAKFNTCMQKNDITACAVVQQYMSEFSTVLCQAPKNQSTIQNFACLFTKLFGKKS